MAYTSIMFSHNGNVSSDSLDDRAFIALSISMTTRLILVGCFQSASLYDLHVLDDI